MKNLLSKLWYLFDRRDRIQLCLFFILILGGTGLEVLGIGAILPFIALLSKPEYIQENAYLRQVYDWIEPTSLNQFIIWMGAGMMGIYILKNIYLLLVVLLQSHFLNRKIAHIGVRLYQSYLYSPYPFHLKQNSAQSLRNLGIVNSIMMGIVLPLLNITTEMTVTIILLIFLMWVDFNSSLISSFRDSANFNL